ncbi:MAG: DUF6444 domain-containing protein, partial [Endozoicomonas sp.]|uniref:DUF6444 domain-containing protein n=1 Tax=Endozoicomonas sp. TaxID=1892382 RepID=UPI003D9B50F1
MQKQITKLEEENKELAGRLNTNSQNSSKPPSTDGYGKATSPKKGSKSADPSSEEDDQSDKPNPKSLRQPSGRMPGGQKGHKGTTLKQVAEPDRTHYHPRLPPANRL